MNRNIKSLFKLHARKQALLSNRAKSLDDCQFLKTTAYDSWVVLSPGRTGSKVIVDIIGHFYGYQMMNLTYDAPVICEQSVTEVRPLGIIHSHQAMDYEKFVYFTPHIVISTRDMVESALSFVIQKRIKEWHFYSTEDAQNIEIEPFKLDLDEFYEHYDDSLRFYTDLKKALSKYKPRKNFHIIDYSEFKNNSSNIYNILNFKNINYVHSSSLLGKVPVLNPGIPHDWISNWYTIEYIFARLKRKPELL
jgi:hypothetical protein